jgi:hypothetical protein
MGYDCSRRVPKCPTWPQQHGQPPGCDQNREPMAQDGRQPHGVATVPRNRLHRSPNGEILVAMIARLCIVLSCLPLTLLGGCSSGSQAPKCVPGASAACACPTGQPGAQVCASTATYGACVCGTAAMDGGGLGGAAGTDVPTSSSSTGGQVAPHWDASAGGAGGVPPDAETEIEVQAEAAPPDTRQASPDALTGGPDTLAAGQAEVTPDTLQSSPDATLAACPYPKVMGTFCLGYWHGDRSVPHTWCVQACQDVVTGVHVADTIGTTAICMATAQGNSGDPTTHTGTVACIPAGTCDTYCPDPQPDAGPPMPPACPSSEVWALNRCAGNWPGTAVPCYFGCQNATDLKSPYPINSAWVCLSADQMDGIPNVVCAGGIKAYCDIYCPVAHAG